MDAGGGDGAGAADAPVVAAKFDDGGRSGDSRFAGVQDEGQAVAELAKDFIAAGAGGRAGKIGAGAGDGRAVFADEIADDFAFGPAESNAARVGGHFERKAVGGVEDDGKRAGPAGFGEFEKIVGEIAGKKRGLVKRTDEDGEGAGFGAALNAKDFVDGGEVEGIGDERVERVGGSGDDRTAAEPVGGVADEERVGILCGEFENFGGQDEGLAMRGR